MDREVDGHHLHGGYRQGGKLPPEREPAELLATTRRLLREALISPEALGYLDIRNRQGIHLAGDVSSEALGAPGQAWVWPMEILSQVMEGAGGVHGPLQGHHRNDGEAEPGDAGLQFFRPADGSRPQVTALPVQEPP